jgi:putative spermidine/putrescine transport system permease protein
MRITLPLSLPGVLAGATLTFAIAIGAYATVRVLGEGRIQTLSTLVYDRIVTSFDWGGGAAIAVVLLVLGFVGLGALGGITRLTRDRMHR